MAPIRVAIVGVGKIARDQHVPSIAASPDFELVATASRNGRIEGVPAFPDIETLLAKADGLDAIALCMPPGPRHAAALTALRAGKHVLLEKPPGATLSELDDLVALAEKQRVSLFATWHSRFAAGRRRRQGLAGRPHDPLGPAWTGRRMCADGIRGRPGYGSRAASACSILG